MHTRRWSLIFIILCALNSEIAAQQPRNLHEILSSSVTNDQKQIELARLCYARFLRSSGQEQAVSALVDSSAAYGISGQQELKNLAHILIHRRKSELKKADTLLQRAILVALQHSEKVFLYQFYLNRAYVQSDLGNALEAVYCYRQARRLAEELNNADLLSITDIGVSDIYMNIGLFSQALLYLDQTQLVHYQQKIRKPSIQKLIYLNKAEIYFNLSKPDSLIRYTKLVRSTGIASSNDERNIRRLEYFALILEKKYGQATSVIKALLNSNDQYYRNIDRWHLTECYYHNGQIDSASAAASKLASDPHVGSSNIKVQAFNILARIAADRQQIKRANHFLMLALRESENYKSRMAKIADLATELRLDRVESAYMVRHLIYKKERTIMLMTTLGACLVIIIIFILYRNIRQKSKFQKALHRSRADELAFINSHYVRRPLANILGICILAQAQQPDSGEIKEYLGHIHDEARDMDERLKEIAKKLNSH